MGPFGVIFGPLWATLGHFWAILWHFGTNLREVKFFLRELESRDSLLECMDEVVVKHIVEVNTQESDDVHHYTAPTLVPDL